jgi:hypothetical protein
MFAKWSAERNRGFRREFRRKQPRKNLRDMLLACYSGALECPAEDAKITYW